MRRLIGAAIAGIVLAVGLAQPGFASPDADRAVLYNAHVDSPKVYWQQDNFVLRSDARGESRPVEKTLNWLGRGYSIGGTQLYSMEAPEGGDLAFMGVEAGDLMYSAPAVNGRNNGPIWAGFGADASIPVEMFRDKKFDLEIVGFNGPGRMEMLTYFDGAPVRRFLSSHDPYMRQTWVDPGNHTHNQTVFTRPGRYEVAFRATARDAANHIVASKPQTLVWQVGGPNPELATLGDVVSAYNAAPQTGEGEFAPLFSVEPNQDLQADGDDKLSTLTFSTGNSADSGAVVFYADGFYLGEVPLKGGVARWNELLGSQDLSLQAVFVPAASSPSPRWISAAIELSRTARTGSTSELGEFPKQVVREPAPEFSTAEYVPTSPTVNFEFKASEDGAALTAKPQDERLWFKVRGGAYEAGSDYPSCEIEYVSTPTHRTWDSGELWDCAGDDMEVRLDLITPTTVSLSGARAVFPLNEQKPKPVDLGVGSGGEGPGEGPGDEPGAEPEPGEDPGGEPGGEPGDEPGDTPSPDVPNPTDSTTPTENAGPDDLTSPSGNDDDTNQTESDSLATTPVTISRGHVDIGPAVLDGKFSVVVNDDSREHAKTSVSRAPSSVTLALGGNAKVKRSAKIFGDSVFDFLGDAGTELYVSPMQQKSSIVWPGFSSEHLDRTAFPTGVKFEIKPKTAPASASWWLFTHDVFNGLDMIASSDEAGQIDAPEPLHKHVYWAFNKPGAYAVTVTISGTDADGKKHSSTADIRFQIGEVGADSPGEGPSPDAPEPGDGPSADTPEPDGTGDDADVTETESTEPTGSPTESTKPTEATQPNTSETETTKPTNPTESKDTSQTEATTPPATNPSETTKPSERPTPGHTPGNTPGHTTPPAGSSTLPNTDLLNGVLPPSNRAQNGENGFIPGTASAGATISRGGAPASIPNSIAGLAGLPAAEPLQSGDAEPSEATDPSAADELVESDTTLESAHDHSAASPMIAGHPSTGGEHGSRVSVPLVIMVASGLVALAAGAVLLKRRLASRHP